MNMGSVNKRDVTATLMDLVRKGYLILKNETYIKDGFFRDKEVEDYSLTLNPEAPETGLLSHESCLINWFVKKIGDGSRVFLDQISGHVRTEADARRFTRNYQNWCGMVRMRLISTSSSMHPAKRQNHGYTGGHRIHCSGLYPHWCGTGRRRFLPIILAHHADIRARSTGVLLMEMDNIPWESFQEFPEGFQQDGQGGNAIHHPVGTLPGLRSFAASRRKL